MALIYYLFPVSNCKILVQNIKRKYIRTSDKTPEILNFLGESQAV